MNINEQCPEIEVTRKIHVLFLIQSSEYFEGTSSKNRSFLKLNHQKESFDGLTVVHYGGLNSTWFLLEGLIDSYSDHLACNGYADWIPVRATLIGTFVEYRWRAFLIMWDWLSWGGWTRRQALSL